MFEREQDGRELCCIAGARPEVDTDRAGGSRRGNAHVDDDEGTPSCALSMHCRRRATAIRVHSEARWGWGEGRRAAGRDRGEGREERPGVGGKTAGEAGDGHTALTSHPAKQGVRQAKEAGDDGGLECGVAARSGIDEQRAANDIGDCRPEGGRDLFPNARASRWHGKHGRDIELASVSGGRGRSG